MQKCTNVFSMIVAKHVYYELSIKNRIGTSIEPLGTPYSLPSQGLYERSTLVLCFLFLVNLQGADWRKWDTIRIPFCNKQIAI